MTGEPLAARLARLRQQAAAVLPEAWRPAEPGDTLAGELVRYDSGHTDYGDQHIAIIRDEAGVERAFWLLHAVALDEFKKLRPAPGELVAIRYLGRRTNAAGTEYTSYRVVVDREALDPGPPGPKEPEPHRSESEEDDAPPF